MKQNRNTAIAETLKYEGGYTNNPSDPGGPTNWGITIADAKKYWKPDATAADVKSMPKEVAIDIYVNKYWKTPYYDCDSLAAGVDFSVFDYGVNSGPSRAKTDLMNAIGGTDEETIDKIWDLRRAFLRRLKNYPVFKGGWERRCSEGRTFAHKMASTATPEPVEKLNDTEATQATPESIWDRITGWWSRIKSLDFNWKAFGRQLSIAGTAVAGFYTEHKLLTLTAIVMISLFAVWVALGRPRFWKVW